MKRQSFLTSLAAVGTALALPAKSLARGWQNFRDKTGFLVASGKDRADKPITVFDGDTFTTKVSTSDTNGDLYVFESARVKASGPALHYHFDQDEWWYVLEGEFLIKVGDNTFHVKTGDSVFGPRNIPHTFSKLGGGTGRLLMSFQPAGKMEAFFIKVSEGVLKGLSEEEQGRVCEAHGFKRVGPPIGVLKQ